MGVFFTANTRRWYAKWAREVEAVPTEGTGGFHHRGTEGTGGGEVFPLSFRTFQGHGA